MSKSSQIFSSICIISILVLPTFFFLLIVLPITIYNMITTLFSGFNVFFTVFGIIFLLSFIAPPPLQKKKRIIFIQTFKAIFKRLYKSESTEEIVFKDDLIHFVEFSHDLIHFVEYTPSMIPNYDRRNSNINLQSTRPMILSRLKKIKLTSFPSNSMNIIKNFSFCSVFNYFSKKSPQKITFKNIKTLGGGDRNFLTNNFYKGVEIHG